MIFRIEVKHDTKHTKFHKLSVSSYSKEALVNDLVLYVQQYAIDNQMNWHQIGARVVDTVNNNVVYIRESNAFMNRPVIEDYKL